MALIVPRQSINNVGTSGNARVVNIVGDCIMQDADGVGAETQAVLESIDQRLRVVHDEQLGMSGYTGFTHLRSNYDVLENKIDGWLSAPDVSQNFNAAQEKRQAGTGSWFLASAQFLEWKETPNIVLCIYGDRANLSHFTMIPISRDSYQRDAERLFFGSLYSCGAHKLETAAELAS